VIMRPVLLSVIARPFRSGSVKRPLGSLTSESFQNRGAIVN